MLGVAVDHKMKFERHIANVCRKVSQQIAVLKRMKKILLFETRECLCLEFIIPQFTYCSETWHFCNKNITAKLEKVNERALRFCSFSNLEQSLPSRAFFEQNIGL